MKKLTLSMEEETIKEAKRLAAERGTSVSAMFSRIVQAMAHEPGEGIEIGPITRRLSGIISQEDASKARAKRHEA
jgi:hypothetical protein